MKPHLSGIPDNPTAKVDLVLTLDGEFVTYQWGMAEDPLHLFVHANGPHPHEGLRKGVSQWNVVRDADYEAWVAAEDHRRFLSVCPALRLSWASEEERRAWKAFSDAQEAILGLVDLESE